MSERRVLVRGGWVVSMDARIGNLPRGDVLIQGGRILDVAATIDAADASIIDATAMIVIPGLIDTHRHTWQSCVRHRYADVPAE